MARFQNVRQKSKRSAAVPAANCGLEARAESLSPSPGSGTGNLAGDGFQPSVTGRIAGATEELIERLQRHYGLPELEMAIELHRGIVRIHLSERERREGPEAEAFAGKRWDASPTVGQGSARELVRLIDHRREVLRKVIDDANEILGEASPFRDVKRDEEQGTGAESLAAIRLSEAARVTEQEPQAQARDGYANEKEQEPHATGRRANAQALNRNNQLPMTNDQLEKRALSELAGNRTNGDSPSAAAPGTVLPAAVALASE